MARKKIGLFAPVERTVMDLKTGKPVDRVALPVLCERIHFYRVRRGMEQKALAESVGVTANAVSNWENGRSRPDVNLLPALCRALDVTFYDLFRLPDPSAHFSSRQQLLMEKFGRLSPGYQHVLEKAMDSLLEVEQARSCPELTVLTYYSRRLAAGIGDPSEFDDGGEKVYLYASPEINRADCIFTVNGNSMEPDFRSGQDVLVQRLGKGRDLRFGDIGAFIVGNETYIKKYQADGLYSLHPDYPPLRFETEDAVYLIGRVIGVLDRASYARPEDVRAYQLLHGNP